MSVVYNIRLPKELIDKVEEIAVETDRPKAYIVKKAIEQYLNEYVDYSIALDRLKNNLTDIEYDPTNNEEMEVRNVIKYYLHSFSNFFDIGITRLIESLIGIV